ncbi:GNAT family N-acetyltransferase [Bacillus sp. JJ722]|uniref:GNAT family N-acetyltransferase n=1 Tax=Bacillus sp. JJ722 TaxID=3122973 RepID=UPI002FFE1CFF
MNIDISKLVYRNATEEDTKEIKLIAEEVIIKNYTSFLDADTTRAYIVSGESSNEIDSNIENIIVSEYEGEIIGLAILMEDLLHLIMVKHSYQGDGLGGALLKYVEKELFKKHNTIRLETFEDNTPTIEFYKKHNWKIIEKVFSEFINGFIIKFEKQGLSS